MTIHIVINCDGSWEDGTPCQVSYPSPEYHFGDALWEAEQHDWRRVDTTEGVRHYCPLHAPLAIHRASLA